MGRYRSDFGAFQRSQLLKIPTKGKLPAHLLYACAILGTPEVRSQAVQKFVDQVSQRLEQLALEHGTRRSSTILTRDLTDEELASVKSWVGDSDTAGESDTAGAGGSDTYQLMQRPKTFCRANRAAIRELGFESGFALGAFIREFLEN